MVSGVSLLGLKVRNQVDCAKPLPERNKQEDDGGWGGHDNLDGLDEPRVAEDPDRSATIAIIKYGGVNDLAARRVRREVAVGQD